MHRPMYVDEHTFFGSQADTSPERVSLPRVDAGGQPSAESGRHVNTTRTRGRNTRPEDRIASADSAPLVSAATEQLEDVHVREAPWSGASLVRSLLSSVSEELRGQDHW